MNIELSTRDKVAERRKPLLWKSEPVQPPLCLAMQGLADGDANTLRSMLQVLAPRLRIPVQWVAVEQAHVVVVARACLRDSRQNGVLSGRGVIVLRHDGELGARGNDLVLTHPLRVMPVLDALNTWIERCGLAVAPAPAPSVPEVHDETPGHTGTLAHALQRIFAQEAPHDAHVRVIGLGELSILTHRKRYHADIPMAQLRASMRTRRFVISGNCDHARRMPDGELRALNELRWVAALESGDLTESGLPAQFRLTRWPDFGSLPHDVEHLKLAALLSGREMTVANASMISAMHRSQVLPFLHACKACGYLVASQAPVAPAVEPVKPSRLGLFDRLRRRFGF